MNQPLLQTFRDLISSVYEVHNLFSSPSIIIIIIKMIISSRMRWAGHVVHMGEMRNTYKCLSENLKGKTPLERPRQRWKGIIMDLTKTGCEGVDWIHLAQDRGQ
jgi:hypothetical protein